MAKITILIEDLPEPKEGRDVLVDISSDEPFDTANTGDWTPAMKTGWGMIQPYLRGNFKITELELADDEQQPNHPKFN